MNQWDQFLTPYQQAVEELKIKLKGLRKQYELIEHASPIEFVTGRVKPITSIIEKANKRDIQFDRLHEEMYDIAGLRMMCQFVDDIDVVVELLRQRKDFKVIEERDYINNMKESGYRSYHVIISYPIETLSGQKDILAEIQIRTLAMNFWATIEHTLRYKYDGDYPPEIQNRLERAAEAAYLLDEEMSEIKEEIQEAQKYYSKKRAKKHEN
ncbi:GTP pyrophosphokinase [Staphylococcus massiliensis]|uniref:GTP diphosphokinase n=1 Tax=Staphylococcus massiliensis S46 TaxID=1229783 RepID=K9APZ9_9STAP|nr:GTP pyrophosphokinase family protein [Staphylococcus massiliensis]EKU48101.1 GTP pyrophosphokinase [Staphylococcus massiliensis S46]MCG3399853.1 GTP pyrophosphokinase family protein [Staphylococcus massiliensis]MCG3401590.1 GTP pyrophosphokinase family protein [Staphylococcus massiliensis]MCG3412124.1 GTP pyrophosphokinase family protein [Staphylococcus massiliensis]PNZ98224.1 GTP pyrophosphokinase [Staphylococcus massiliensis CCUG 55927]